MKKLLTLVLIFIAAPAWSATCKISEYANMVTDPDGRVVPVAVEPATAEQNITYSSSNASAAFNAATRFVRIVCDAKAHFEFGTTPIAETTDPYVPGDTPEYFGIVQGISLKVAFIAAA